MAASNRDREVYLAKLTEQAERYDDMITHMKNVASMGVDFTAEERNLLSVAYKNVVGARRAAWRVLVSAERRDEAKGCVSSAGFAAEYRRIVEAEISHLCHEVLELLDGLEAKCSGAEEQVFYRKMRGDYHRYIAEFSLGAARCEAAERARQAYEDAIRAAREGLPVTSPVRLGLALNYSVFLCEVLDDANEACRLARDAFKEALPEMDALPKQAYKETALIMQLLRDNLTLWTSMPQSEEKLEA